MTTPHEHAEILRAIADGKEVEWFDFRNNEWFPLAYNGRNPITFEHLEWRIKPEKKMLRYRVALLKNDKAEKSRAFAFSDSWARYIEQDISFVKWIHDWQEVEVE
jgi:hypothetical protein